ncbi:MAG: hypothetical protein K2N78_12480 [Oscillospiraceae bacterium]|nr:hypothetical protein [Oscillospiraceae bacterium]
MKPYQEEYIANIQSYNALEAALDPEDRSPEDCLHRLERAEGRRRQLIVRNMELLRKDLLSQLDGILAAGDKELEDLSAFAAALYDGRTEVDLGMFCNLHQDMLNLARQKEDRDATIRELYWLGIGRFALYNKLSGLSLSTIGPYLSQVRLCFAEAATYLKYFPEIENEETQGYIMRSMANMALGQFNSVGERTLLLKRALRVFQNPAYQAMAPGLPWERYIRQTRQLMISSMSYGREHAMSPQDVHDIMESVNIVYKGKTRPEDVPLARQGFHLYSIEYFCGIHNLDTLLAKLEALMDSADTQDYSRDGMYALISLPAFYSQYLNNAPEAMTPDRTRYVSRLYRRILAYTENFPQGQEDSTLFLYLRQLSMTYLETEQGVPYAVFQRKLMARFTPDLFLHARAVAAGAAALSEIMLESDPEFFDEMEDIQAIKDPAAKRRAVTDLAEQCGMFHDMGKLNCLDLYLHTPRQWFPEEYEVTQLHTVTGSQLLKARPSTARLANAALGHHSWYDGSHPYPGDYLRQEHPDRNMTDIISLINWITDATSVNALHRGPQKTFGEAVDTAIELSGTRFSPLLTAKLQSAEAVQRIHQALEQGQLDACREMAAGKQGN